MPVAGVTNASEPSSKGEIQNLPTTTVAIQQQPSTDEEEDVEPTERIGADDHQNSTENDDDEEEGTFSNGDQDNNLQQENSTETEQSSTTWKIMMPSWDTVENLTWAEQYEEARAYEDLCYVTFSSEVIISKKKTNHLI